MRSLSPWPPPSPHKISICALSADCSLQRQSYPRISLKQLEGQKQLLLVKIQVQKLGYCFPICQSLWLSTLLRYCLHLVNQTVLNIAQEKLVPLRWVESLQSTVELGGQSSVCCTSTSHTKFHLVGALLGLTRTCNCQEQIRKSWAQPSAVVPKKQGYVQREPKYWLPVHCCGGAS